jgi:MFS family permease
VNDASIFISYSHKDEVWKERFAKHLSVLQKQGALTFWDDRQIGAGELWDKKIQDAINTAKIAILLISADYLNSEFILREEVARLMERRAENDLIIIPVIVKSCPWDEVDWLKRMQVRPRDGRPLASFGGDRRDEALSAIAKEVSNRLASFRRFPYPPEPQSNASSESDRRERAEDHRTANVKNLHQEEGETWDERVEDRITPEINVPEARRRLLTDVRRIWIDGVLKDMSAPVAASFNVRVRGGKETGGTTAAESNSTPPDQDEPDVSELFDQANYQSVILGGAGAGKTFKLLELLRDLLERAEGNSSEPIPVMLNLSSWAEWASRKKSMAAWLISELESVHGLPRKLARHLVCNGALTLLLDGLDEITSGGAEPSSAREAQVNNLSCRNKCLEELNRYIALTGVGVALCCRTEGYAALDKQHRTRWEDAIIMVLPLTDDDVQAFLKDAGPELSSLRAAMSEDQALRAMALKPFFLVIMATAYKEASGISTKRIFEGGRGSEEARKMDLFEKYVNAQNKIPRPGLMRQYYLTDIKHYLGELAEKMEQGDSKLFFVDQLQPNSVWLNGSGRWTYRALVSLFLFLFMWVLAGLPAGWALGYEGNKGFHFQGMFLTALFCGGLVVAGFVFSKTWGFGIWCGLAFGVGRAISRRLGTDEGKDDWLFQGLISAALGIAVLGLLTYLRRHERDRIKLLRRSKFYVSQALLGVITAIFVGAALGLMLTLMKGDASFGWPRGFGFGLALIPILALGFGYLSADQEIKISTDQGLRHSVRTAVGSTILCALFGAVCFGAVYGKFRGPQEGTINTILGLSLGVISLAFGAVPVFQHLSLRIILWRRGHLPRKLVDFLNESTKLKLLSKVGGGHMFQHEHLRAYFRKLRQYLHGNGAAGAN